MKAGKLVYFTNTTILWRMDCRRAGIEAEKACKYPERRILWLTRGEAIAVVREMEAE